MIRRSPPSRDGETYEGTVKSTTAFGAFVEIMPDRGLLASSHSARGLESNARRAPRSLTLQAGVFTRPRSLSGDGRLLSMLRRSESQTPPLAGIDSTKARKRSCSYRAFYVSPITGSAVSA